MEMKTLLAGLALLAAAASLDAAEVTILGSGVDGSQQVLAALRPALAGHVVRELDVAHPATAEALKARPAVIVALGPAAVRAARSAQPDVALVYALVADPAAAGLAGANVTGVTYALPIKVQFASFRHLHRGAVYIGVVFDPTNTAAMVEEARAAFRLLGLVLVERPVAGEREVLPQVRALFSGPDAVQALWVPPDPLLLTEGARRAVFAEAFAKGRPVLTFSPRLVAEGALASHSADPTSVGQQVAYAVGRLLSGESPTQVGILSPRGQLTVNKKVGERLKIVMNPDTLKAAVLY